MLEPRIHSTLEAQLPITYWVPVLKSLYKFILSITQGPTIWVPALLGIGVALWTHYHKKSHCIVVRCFSVGAYTALFSSASRAYTVLFAT